jgi:PAS domain S-box-containing protein
VPLILLADATDVSLLADLTTRRFNATLLTKPVEPTQLVAAVRAGLRYSASRRQNRRLMAQLEAAYAESERRRAEAEAAQRRFHDLVQGLDSVVWEADATTGRVTFVSHRVEGLLGYPVGRWLADPDLRLGLHPSRGPRVRAGALAAAACATAATSSGNTGIIAADGRTIWIREAVARARDDQGRPIGLRGLMWDITKRKKVERQLYTVKQQLAEQLADMTYLHELSNRLSATTELEPTLEEILAAVMGRAGGRDGGGAAL